MKSAKLIGLLMSVIAPAIVSAQDCREFFPGDCPDTTSINSTMDAKQNLDEGISASIAGMKDSARKVFWSELQRISKKENWSVMELGDYFGYGPLLAVPYNLPDEKRPPVQYGVAYQFMFNPDSIKLAKKWLNDHYEKVESSTQTDVSTLNSNMKTHASTQQQRMDSAQHYGELETQYAEANAKAFQDATLSNNQAFINQYNKKMDYYNKKINEFTASANEQTEQDESKMKNDANALHEEKQDASLRFRNACVLQVYIECHAGVSSVPDDAKESPPQNLQVNGATKSFLFHNNKPEVTNGNVVWDCSKASSIAMLLFGPWIPDASDKYSYRPAFSTDRKNSDSETVKKIPGNKIQNISIHVCGRKDYVMKFIHDFDATSISKLIAVSQ